MMSHRYIKSVNIFIIRKLLVFKELFCKVIDSLDLIRQNPDENIQIKVV